MEFSAVVPLFNEVNSLEALQERLHKVMDKISSEYEIIYVDDGSTDSTLAVLRRLKEDYPKIKIIVFDKNRGQSTGLSAGFKASQGKWIITLDADLQNPPEEILKLLEFKDDFNLVMGIRKTRKDTFSIKFSSFVGRVFCQILLGDKTVDPGCSLRIFERNVLGKIPCFRNFHYFFAYLFKAEKLLVKEVCVEHNCRMFGRSKYGFFKRIEYGICCLGRIFWLRKRALRHGFKDKCRSVMD